MDGELRKNVRQRWLGSLFEFAHLEFQRRLWTGGYPGLVGDYGEAVCQYFNDLSLEDGYDKFIAGGFVDKTECDIVSDFHRLLDEYVGRPDKQNLRDDHILRDPEWHMLTAIAKENWNKLKSVVTDKEERVFMTALEKRL